LETTATLVPSQKIGRHWGVEFGIQSSQDSLHAIAIAIIQFIAKWQQRCDVVYAVREKRKEIWLKRLAFEGFYHLLNFLSGMKLPIDAGIFSLVEQVRDL
jgi:hypothetical protein